MTLDNNPPHPPPSLPNEILTLIFSHLDQHQQTLYQCSFVSKRFHLVANPMVWNKIQLGNARTRRFLASISTASSHQRLSLLGYHIEYLCVDNEFWTDDHLLCLLPHIPRLKHLSLDNHARNITETSFQQLPYYCQQLTYLDLCHTSLTQVSFSAIGRHCHQLGELELRLDDQQQLPAWLELLTPCPLRTLKLFTNHQINDPTTTKAIQSFDLLTTLQIIYATSTPPTADSLLHCLSTPTPTDLWPDLKSLLLYPYNCIHESALIQFIKSHPALQYLNLEGDFPVSDATLDTMAICLEHLDDLTLDSETTLTVSPGSILWLIYACPHLTSIELLNCNNAVSECFPGILDFDGYNTIALDEKRIDRIRQGKENNDNNFGV